MQQHDRVALAHAAVVAALRNVAGGNVFGCAVQAVVGQLLVVVLLARIHLAEPVIERHQVNQHPRNGPARLVECGHGLLHAVQGSGIGIAPVPEGHPGAQMTVGSIVQGMHALVESQQLVEQAHGLHVGGVQVEQVLHQPQPGRVAALQGQRPSQRVVVGIPIAAPRLRSAAYQPSSQYQYYPSHGQGTGLVTNSMLGSLAQTALAAGQVPRQKPYNGERHEAFLVENLKIKYLHLYPEYQGL